MDEPRCWSTAKAFGSGEETVMDPSYRHGTELKADELAFTLRGTTGYRSRDDYERIVSNIQEELSTSMFVGKKVILLYKLAIYGEGMLTMEQCSLPSTRNGREESLCWAHRGVEVNVHMQCI